MILHIDKVTHEPVDSASDATYDVIVPSGGWAWSPTVPGFVRVPTLAEAQQEQWAAVKARREREFLVTPTPFGPMDSDADGRSNISGQIEALREMETLGIALPETITWKLHDNSVRDFTLTEFRQAALAVMGYRAAVYAASWSKESEISAATDVAGVAAVDLDGGWPS